MTWWRSTVSDLTSEFLLLPKREEFLHYNEFRSAYEVLKKHTNAFQNLSEDQVWNALRQDSRVFCVVRAILGVSPPEWGELATKERDNDMNPNDVRTYDGNCRRDPSFISSIMTSTRATKTPQRLRDLISVAVQYLSRGAPTTDEGVIHRLDRFDTARGVESIRHASMENVPYAVLLYERYLGRPFATHRDAVSELIGEMMENAVEDQLRAANITYRKTKRAERIPIFEQAPDFCIPDEQDPDVIIEAKITSDDGTARDKVARILRLAHERDRHRDEEDLDYEVIACIDGRGFAVRTEDMRQMLEALDGKVFTTATLDRLTDHTRLRNYAS